MNTLNPLDDGTKTEAFGSGMFFVVVKPELSFVHHNPAESTAQECKG